MPPYWFVLSTVTSIRSFGLPTDIAFFAVLQSQMLFHLRWHGSGTYQNLELGTYTHVANSFHIYERNFELAERMLTKKFESLEIPKVNQSLITTTGKTSSAFTELFNDYNISLTDPLFLWIQKNINLWNNLLSVELNPS